MAITFGPSIPHGTTLAKTSVASVSKKGTQPVVTLRTGANGVSDNQRLQAIAQALGRGDVTEADINA